MNIEKTFASFFNQAADQASEVVLRYFRQDIPVDEKDDNSPVTQADRETEQVLRTLVRKEFPNHGFIGEEFGRENEHAEFVWVVDPIDGTKSFATGRPLFGTIIGLLHQGKPVAGLIEQAYTKERWFGITDQLAMHNNRPIKVAATRDLSQARLYTGSISMFDDENFGSYLTLCRASKWTQYSCDCYAYGLLAMGWADLVVEQKLGLYDIAGIVPIVTGAGGVVQDWQGQPVDINFKGQAIAASSLGLAMQAIKILNK